MKEDKDFLSVLAYLWIGIFAVIIILLANFLIFPKYVAKINPGLEEEFCQDVVRYNERKRIEAEERKRKEATYLILDVDYVGERRWLIRVSKDTAKAIRENKVSVRLHVDYCWYDPKDVNINGDILFSPDWTPSVEKSRITVGIFKQTNKPELGSGYYVSSVLIKKAKPLSLSEPSRRIRKISPSFENARIAQPEEQGPCKPKVEGSTPSTGSTLAGQSSDALTQTWNGG